MIQFIFLVMEKFIESLSNQTFERKLNAKLYPHIIWKKK